MDEPTDFQSEYQALVLGLLTKQNDAESLHIENEQLRKALQQEQNATWEANHKYSREVLNASRDREIAHLQRVADALERMEKVLARLEAK